MNIASYRAKLSIERPEHVSPDEGQQYIGYWGGVVVSDLRADLLDPNLPDRLPQFAAKAHLWFTRAWDSANTHERRFPITQFVVELFDERGQQGRMVAEVDVLTGAYRETV